jgi:hypothetical protein
VYVSAARVSPLIVRKSYQQAAHNVFTDATWHCTLCLRANNNSKLYLLERDKTSFANALCEKRIGAIPVFKLGGGAKENCVVLSLIQFTLTALCVGL